MTSPPPADDPVADAALHERPDQRFIGDRDLMRIAWRTVGAIVTRVAQDAMAGVDRFAQLHRIGIDEISS